MVRLPLLLTAAAAAVAAAVTPAIAGLTGNPSFSEQLPVSVPSRATSPSFPSQPAYRRPATRAPPTADPRRARRHVPTVPAPSSHRAAANPSRATTATTAAAATAATTVTAAEVATTAAAMDDRP